MNIIWDYIFRNIPQVLTAAVSITAIWAVLSRAVKVLKEISELLNAIVVALADKKLTRDEIDIIIKEAKDIPVAVKGLLKRS